MTEQLPRGIGPEFANGKGRKREEPESSPVESEPSDQAPEAGPPTAEIEGVDGALQPFATPGKKTLESGKGALPMGQVIKEGAVNKAHSVLGRQNLYSSQFDAKTLEEMLGETKREG